VHPVNAAVLVQQFLRLFGMTGADAVLEERGDVAIERWIDKTGLVRVESWNVRDMGHAWSGGSFRGSHTYPRGPRASDAMMEFFLRDRRAV
jgi:poly(3-hydroxybutyrate) depolymerase